jgi:catechol 2,3-dioxygenase-like lactoylglutathione lyase family enzyme
VILFDHVTIRVSRRAESESFYDAVLPRIGIEKSHSSEDYAEWGVFSLAAESVEKPATRHLHVGFAAASREDVDAFWRAGIEAGYRDDGAPGERPQYSPTYYGAFLLDPDGLSVEAVHHASVQTTSQVDHLWLRVTGLDESKFFYDRLAPYTGFDLRRESQVRAQFAGAGASFSVVTGTSTRNAHLAFPAHDNETVDAFHQAALELGFRDNGPPGERAVYHAGYYSAFVLDPDGNNVEVVNHNRE